MDITAHVSMNLTSDHASHLMMQHLVQEHGVSATADALSWITRNLALWMAEDLHEHLRGKLSTLVTEAQRNSAGGRSVETTTLEDHCQQATRDMLTILLSGNWTARAQCVPPGMDKNQENRYALDRMNAFAGLMQDLLMCGWNHTEFYQLAREYMAVEEGK